MDINNKITIAIPHFQTLELIKLCLRSIRKYTPQPYNVIVIDNGSRDESLEYLRSVKWIKLIQRDRGLAKTGSWAHGSALDIGLKNTDTEFFLALHSDVIIKNSSWLNKLISPFKNKERLACVGSGKLEEISRGYRIVKKMGDVKGLYRFIRRKIIKVNRNDNQPKSEYIRTICALYRTEILKKERLSFLPVKEEGLTSGQALYYELIRRGYLTLYFSPDEMKRIIDHLNHGTMILNPSLGVKKRTIQKGMIRLKKKLRDEMIKDILEDSTLDQ